MAESARVFLSYSWDDDSYRDWVKRLARRLREDGVDARLDEWHLQNVTIAEFMNREIRRADKILFICSPLYRSKVHAMEEGHEASGVGWESMVLSAQILGGAPRSKILVAVARGKAETAIPDFLRGYRYIDLSSASAFEAGYRQLLETIVGYSTEPSLGKLPEDLYPPKEPDSPSLGWFENPKDGTLLVHFPSCVFRMGSKADEITAGGWRPNPVRPDELIAHAVELDSFWFARTPITNAQYRKFCGEAGYALPNRIQALEFSGDEQPVIGVSWHDANAYLDWAGLRMPTEAEWERVAAGIEGRVFPWGGGPPTPDRANFGANLPGSLPVTACVAGATPEGVLDLAGNVLEWCADGPREYKPRRQRNPLGPLAGPFRVLRGGSLRRQPNQLRSRYRDARDETATWGSTGIRAALTIPISGLPPEVQVPK